jgi:methionyl-tRNA formyltransferase
MGTPEIAATCLQRIHEDGHEILGVYTKVDTPKNRGMKLTPSPVKDYALAHGLPVYQPTTFRED